MPAFTHVTGEPGEHDRMSFAGLDGRACALAAEIQRRGGVGRPVLVVLDPGADYVASLFGCLYARNCGADLSASNAATATHAAAAQGNYSECWRRTIVERPGDNR